MKKFLILAALLQLFMACETTENASGSVAEGSAGEASASENDVIMVRDAVVDIREKCVSDGIPSEKEDDWQLAEEDFLIGEDYFAKKSYDDAIIFYEKAYESYTGLYSNLMEGNLQERLLEVTALRDRIDMLEFAEFDRVAYDDGVQSLDLASRALAEGGDEDPSQSGEISSNLIEAKNSFLTVLDAGFFCKAKTAKADAEEAATVAVNEKADISAPTEFTDARRSYDAGVESMNNGNSEEAAGNFEIAVSLYKSSVTNSKKMRDEAEAGIEALKVKLNEAVKYAEEADKLAAEGGDL